MAIDDSGGPDNQYNKSVTRREELLKEDLRMRRALEEFHAEGPGVATNRDFLRTALDHPRRRHRVGRRRDAEDRRAGADAQPHDRDREHRKPGVAPERAKRVAKVLTQAGHVHDPFDGLHATSVGIPRQEFAARSSLHSFGPFPTTQETRRPGDQETRSK